LLLSVGSAFITPKEKNRSDGSLCGALSVMEA